MAAFQLSPQADPNKVFLVNLSETEGRLDPNFYKPSYIENAEKIKGVSHKKIKEIARFSNETWNQKDFFSNVFPYIEISEINTTTGEIENINLVKVSDAPSRAKMIVRNNDIIISTTRPNRGAISKISLEEGINIASTGFSIIRDIRDVEIHRDYLFLMLRQSFSLQQMEQRSSGGNYPAITQDELGKVLIPLLSPEEQIKIIEKFQSAYTSKQTAEAEARSLLSSIDDYILAELGITLPTADNSLENRVFYANFSEVSGGRFDPKLYDNNTKALFKAVEQGKYRKVSLRSLVKHSVAGSWGFDEALPLPEDEYTQTLCIRATEFDNLFNLNLDGSRVKYRQIGNTKLKNMDIQPHDLLIEKSGGSPDQPVGRISILTDEILEKHTVSFSNFIHKIRIDPSVCLPEYLFCFLKTMHNIKVTEAMQSQTNGIRNLIMREYFHQTVILPDLDKQEEIAETAQAMRQKAQELMQQGKAILEQTKREVEEMILATPSV